MKAQAILDHQNENLIPPCPAPLRKRNPWLLFSLVAVGAVGLIKLGNGLPVHLLFDSADSPMITAWFPSADEHDPYRGPDPLRQPPPQPIARLRPSGIEILSALYAAEHDGLIPDSPDLDVCEDESETVVRCDLPGVPPADITVEFADGELTIAGKAEQQLDRKWLAREFSPGDFFKRISLDSAIDPDKITASASDGTLIIHLPKPASARLHRIPVRHAIEKEAATF